MLFKQTGVYSCVGRKEQRVPAREGTPEDNVSSGRRSATVYAGGGGKSQ